MLGIFYGGILVTGGPARWRGCRGDLVRLSGVCGAAGGYQRSRAAQ